ncbi:GGDEF domain-containing protein [Massilia glaciei]|uniref:diguanylate cyclase n=1 Tax=Massilia glaciei TaxID=1524097 RepID=A0A2U2HKC3_9BURK|nr:GGDEF domain-containing protein [Massilia glaciei]PWF47987.1 GGDEF domain-containing protein [Massilia glaciei]
MKSLLRLLVDSTDPAQTLRLKRMLVGAVSYFFTIAVVCAFWRLGHFDGAVAFNYMLMVLAVNIGVYAAIRSGRNLRLADPSMTLIQICLSLLIGLYVMYHVPHRGVFLILGISAAMYGLFQFRTPKYFLMTALFVGGYAALIFILLKFRPGQTDLQLELLQLCALLATLLQFSALGSYIMKLRDKVKEKNHELGARNKDLEHALHRISELAIRDELTGVHNRRHLMQMLALEKQRSDRSGRYFSICILDVDFFKKVNDTLGHAAGDAVLREIARAASETTRQTDIFGRYGGEEFALVVSETGIDGALVIAERARARIAALRFPEIAPALRVSVSIGVAEGGRGEAIEATINRADRALYQAKAGGRNRCVAAAGPAPI